MAADPALLTQAEKLVIDDSLPAARAVHQAAAGLHLRTAGRRRLHGRTRPRRAGRPRPPGRRAARRARARRARPGRRRPCSSPVTSPPPTPPALDPTKVLALVTEEGGPTSHTAILARSLGIPAVVACRGVLELEVAALVVDGDTGVVAGVRRCRPRRARGRSRVLERHRRAARRAPGEGARQRRLARRRDGRRGRWRRGRRPVPHRVLLPVGVGGTDRGRAAQGVRGGAGAVRGQTGRGAHPRRRRRQAAGVPRPPSPNRTRRSACAAFESPSTAPTCSTASSKQSPLAAADTEAEVSVMAPMVATAAEAAWFVERARAAGVARAGVMIEIPAAALVAQEILAGRRLRVDRHQRPRPVRLRGRPPGRRGGRAERPVAARRCSG